MNKQSKIKVEVCGLLFKVSLSCRYNEDELENFNKTLLKYACQLLQFQRFMLSVLTQIRLLLKKKSSELKYSASSGNFKYFVKWQREQDTSKSDLVQRLEKLIFEEDTKFTCLCSGNEESMVSKQHHEDRDFTYGKSWKWKRTPQKQKGLF